MPSLHRTMLACALAAPIACGVAGPALAVDHPDRFVAWSPDFKDNGVMPMAMGATGSSVRGPWACGGKDMSPAISWSHEPKDTKSFAVLMDDLDAASGRGGTHWIVYDIPASATRLPSGIAKEGEIKDPAGALQGREDSSVFRGKPDGEPGYRGPNFSASGGYPHPYYFEVFALDTKLGLDPAIAKLRKPLADAMQGHVLASGELLVKFGADDFKTPQ